MTALLQCSTLKKNAAVAFTKRINAQCCCLCLLCRGGCCIRAKEYSAVEYLTELLCKGFLTLQVLMPVGIERVGPNLFFVLANLNGAPLYRSRLLQRVHLERAAAEKRAHGISLFFLISVLSVSSISMRKPLRKIKPQELGQLVYH